MRLRSAEEARKASEVLNPELDNIATQIERAISRFKKEILVIIFYPDTLQELAKLGYGVEQSPMDGMYRIYW